MAVLNMGGLEATTATRGAVVAFFCDGEEFMLTTFSATASVTVRGFDSARDTERVTRVLGQALAEGLSAAVEAGKTAADTPRPAPRVGGSRRR